MNKLIVWFIGYVVLLHHAHCEISFADTDLVQTLPRPNNGPVSIHLIDVPLLPNTTTGADFLATWTLPDGRTLSQGQVLENDERFVVSQGKINEDLNGSILLLQGLSYTDAGVYSCSVQDTRNMTLPPIEISIELILTLTLTTTQSSIAIHDNVSSVEMSCDMSDYIRPDDHLQWFRNGEMIISGQNRNQISYANGPNVGQNGSRMTLTRNSSRLSILTIQDPIPEDTGVYTCSVMGTSESADIRLDVLEGEIMSTLVTTGATTTGPGITEPQAFPLQTLIGSIAGVLGAIVIALIIVIAVVAVQRNRLAKSVTVIPNDFQENGAYASASNGGSQSASLSMIPNYAKVDKNSPPPLPARPSTNLSLSIGNSVNSFIEHEPPGYATPDVPFRKELSGKYNPYYDDPDHLKAQAAEEAAFIAPRPKKNNKKTYYDDVDIVDDRPIITTPYDMTTVPSPADVLNGSMPRANPATRNNPDFSYPIYNAGIPMSDHDVSAEQEHDYDQIYSEPLDPALIRSDFEFDAGSQEAIPYSAIYEDPLPLQEGIAPLLVSRDNIEEVKDLGMGQFGNVILARTIDLSLKDLKLSDSDHDRNISVLVAIKKLKTNAENSLTENFNKEVKFMARLMHDNVIRLLGVCKGSEAFIMMEYMENGDLNQFLQKQRLMPDTISGLQENEVTPIILLYIGVQIASGMHYLASHRFVHRDLATRNCLVGKDFVVKISDFGMSRSLYESAYYRVQGTLVLPIRWMACETFYGKFSVKSDAWAIGVVLWEIYTLGRIDPYDHMTDEEVIADAIRGPDRAVPSKTPNCPQEVYDIMLRCWVHEPSMRADFGEIYSRLFMIYTRQAL